MSIKEELLEVAKGGITDAELSRSREYLKGKVTLSLEDSEEPAHFFGRQHLLYANTKRGMHDVPEYFAMIDAVTKKDIDVLAAELFAPEKLKLVVIGSKANKKELQKLLV